jgi:hypothetical protein
MSDNDPYNNRLEAARFFIDGAGRDDYITVIDFDSYAYVNPINGTLRKADGNRDDLKRAVTEIDSHGGTNLSEGLILAYNQLSSSPTANQKIAILLTDGKGDYNYEASYYAENGWKIFTIGLSESADKALLKDIAQITGGKYFKVTTEEAARYAISEIYRTINQIVHESGEPIIQKEITILQGEIIEMTFEVPEGTVSLWIDRLIPGSDVETSLVQPDGTVIDRDTQDTGVYHALGNTYEIYRIDNPMPGEWTVRLEGTDTGPGGEPTSLSVAATMPDSGYTEPASNDSPVAHAGSDQTVYEGAAVTLDGSASSDPDPNDELIYKWTQTDGTEVVLSDPKAIQPTFIAPEISGYGESLTFELRVKDKAGLKDRAYVTVNIRELSEYQSGDTDRDHKISLTELLNVIQLHNAGGYHCGSASDEYAPGNGDRACMPHNSDYNPQDWMISFDELSRFIELYDAPGYHMDPNTDDGFSTEVDDFHLLFP